MLQKTHTVQTDSAANYVLVRERHIDVFFCAQCCHEMLPLIVKLVVAGLSISHQFRHWLILETNVHSFVGVGVGGSPKVKNSAHF